MNLKQKLLDDPGYLHRMGVKALWWKQPFAGLMLHGKIETRTWPTQYRGWVLICASKQPYYPNELQTFITENQYEMLCKTTTYISPEFCFNEVIAIGRLVNCRLMKPNDEERCWVKYKEPWIEFSKKTLKTRKLALWCHEYEDVHRVEPFVFPGMPGWLNLTTEQIKQIILK